MNSNKYTEMLDELRQEVEADCSLSYSAKNEAVDLIIKLRNMLKIA